LKILVGVGFIRPGPLFFSLEGRGQGEGESIFCHSRLSACVHAQVGESGNPDVIDYLIGRLNKKGRTRLCNIKIKRIYITYYLSQYC